MDSFGLTVFQGCGLVFDQMTARNVRLVANQSMREFHHLDESQGVSDTRKHLLQRGQLLHSFFCIEVVNSVIGFRQRYIDTYMGMALEKTTSVKRKIFLRI